MVFRGIILAMAALMLGTVPVSAFAEETVPAAPDPITAPCKGLKPYNNVNELLYQFYINLDSDCLFEMSTAELEKAWGIKILDDERAKPENYYPLSETEFYKKPYKSEKDAFYVELDRFRKAGPENFGGRKLMTFTLKITKEYFEKHGSLFAAGKFPEVVNKLRVEGLSLVGSTNCVESFTALTLIILIFPSTTSPIFLNSPAISPSAVAVMGSAKSVFRKPAE